MAKARDIDGLRADLPFAEAAAATVAVRAEELFDHADGVLDTTDIERVHDMRVATRRLRAVLEIYAPCFPPERFKPALREVKALADALGARRDPDVLLDRLAGLEDVLPKVARPGLEAFAAPAREEQAHGNRVLEAALAEAERANLRGRLAELAAAATQRDADAGAATQRDADAGAEAPDEAEGSAPADVLAPAGGTPLEASAADGAPA